MLELRAAASAAQAASLDPDAGGAAVDGHQRVLDVTPTELHQRTPLYIGSKSDVDLALAVLSPDAAVPVGVGG